MVSPKLFVESLRDENVTFFAGVPDSLLKNVCAYLTDNFDKCHNIITANEGNAVALVSGYYLATGNVGLVYMQNSGIGNAVNPLISLADEKVYSIPMLLMIGWRGEPGVHDEPQHIKQGEITLQLLETMGIPYQILPHENETAIKVVRELVNRCKDESRPCAVVIQKNTFENYTLKSKVVNDCPVCREEALKLVVDNLPEEAIVVSTTGKLSRELYELRCSHEKDFLTVGSMGHASSIALGIALSKPSRKIFCLDGDGAFIMHMGGLSNIGNLAPENLVHVVFNNGVHESVGAQPTLGFDINLPEIAKSCGYKNVVSVKEESDIINTIKEVVAKPGPSLIEIEVGINSREDLGRPKSTPVENKQAFMNFVKESF